MVRLVFQIGGEEIEGRLEWRQTRSKVIAVQARDCGTDASGDGRRWWVAGDGLVTRGGVEGE